MPTKSQHYWAIHKKVVSRELRNLNAKFRTTLALDVDHSTREFREFEAFVTAETQRLYEDPEYWFNDPYSFRTPIPFEASEAA